MNEADLKDFESELRKAIERLWDRFEPGLWRSDNTIAAMARNAVQTALDMSDAAVWGAREIGDDE